MQEFLTKLAELYATAPSFFNWMALAVPTAFGGVFMGGYWLASEFRSGAMNSQAAQIKLLEAQLSITKQSASNASTAVVDAKQEADILRLAPPNDENRNRLDRLLSTAVTESKVVVIMLHTTGSLAKAIASRKELDVPALEYKPQVPFDIIKTNETRAVPQYELDQTPR